MSSSVASKVTTGKRHKMSGDVVKSSSYHFAATDPRDAILDLQRSVGNRAVNSLVNSTGIGQPLPKQLRGEMEQRFGEDFSRVRLHTDARAAESAAELNANAFTVGNDIMFNHSRFNPGTTRGQRLLAHELAHVVQQSRGGPSPAFDSRAAHERAADATATEALMGNEPLTVSGATGVGVACQVDEDSRDPRWGNQNGSIYVDVQVVDVAPQTADKLRSVLENEYVPTAKKARELLKADPNYNFSAKAARDRGNAYEKAIQEGVTSGDISHPLLDIERGIPRAKRPPEYGDPFEHELTGGQRAKGRISDIGWTPEVTIEGVSTGSLRLEKLNQLWRDLRDVGQVVLVVPELTPEMRRQLSELASKAQASLGGERRIQVLIINGKPAESELAISKPQLSVPRVRPAIPSEPRPVKVKPSMNPVESTSAALPASSGRTSAVTSPQAAPPVKVVPVAELPEGGATSKTAEGKQLKAQTGVPDMTDVQVGRPNQRGEAKSQGAILLLLGVNSLLQYLHDEKERQEVQEALKAIEPEISKKRQDDVTRGVLIRVQYRRFESKSTHADSPIQPVNKFEPPLLLTFGKTLEEAKATYAAEMKYEAPYDPDVLKPFGEIWIPPLKEPTLSEMKIPFPKVAIGTFAGTPEIEDAWWDGEQFHSRGRRSLDVPHKTVLQFFILRPPESIGRQNILIVERPASTGGNLPAVEIEGLPFTHPALVLVFPADELTAKVFKQLVPFGLASLPDEFANRSLVRWINPDKIRIISM